MKPPDGDKSSYWFEGVDQPKPRPLAPDRTMKVNVCVVGAGIAGLTTAYLAAAEGYSVVVLDEGPIGGGQTGRTSAHLASAIDDRFVEIERMHGVESSRLAYESHAAAIDTIERISREENIDCEFARVNAFLNSIASDPPDLLDKELAAAQRAGFADVEKMERAGDLSMGRVCDLGIKRDFHPMLYLIGLAAAFKRKGGKIYLGRRVLDVHGVDPKKKTPGHVKVRGVRQPIVAEHIVVATNTPSPINDWFGIYTKQAAYRSYVIGAAISKDVVEDALYWDTADPYHYVRLEHRGKGDDLLIIGGEDHKTGQLPEHSALFLRLEEWARPRFPKMGDVEYRWSGQVQEPADGLAFIGRAVTDTQEVFVATGDSGMGLTHGTMAGSIIVDQIAGRPNPWEKLYDPSRKILNPEFLKENANTLAQYRDLVTAGEVKSTEDIPAGQGAVMREGLSKVAVYRDEGGKVHKRSAICTHLQCVVRWNHIERSWDCPCHGSRFDAMGKVLMGPAIEDLGPAK